VTFTATWRLPEAEAVRLTDALAEILSATADMTQSRRAAEWIVTAYFEASPDRAALERVCKEALGRRLAAKVTELAPENWVAKSLAGLAPVAAGRYLVHGRHDRERRRGNEIAIEIEAATAFGTGHHGTTAGCLAALSDLAKSRRPRSALDIGTGTGILAIAIAKTWRIPVVATDIDPVATAVAAANARLNRTARYVRTATADGLRHRLVTRAAPFDLIAANILAGPLAKLASAIAARLAPGGVVILSGLLPEQKRWLLAAYRAHGLVLGRAFTLDGWLTLVLERAPFAGRSAQA